jgi:NitT/TauT family transport system substrate-binding protein
VNRRSLVIGVAASAGALSLFPARPLRAQTTAATHVAIGLPPSDDGTPLLYALHSGMLAKAGIDAELSPAQSGAAVSAAVAGGALQIGISSLVPLIGAHARGLSFQLVCPAAVYNNKAPYAAMIVKKDGPIRSARDLNGKTISSPALHDLIGTSNAAWIDQNGGDSSTVKAIELPGSVVLQAIVDGRIDAGTLLEPQLSDALQSGQVRILGYTFDAYGKAFPISGWFATAEYIAANRDLIVRFARVLREANAYCNGHHSETAPLLAAFAKVELARVLQSTRVSYGDVLDLKQIQGVIDVSAKYKVIATPFPASELVSPTVAFLTQA